MSVLKRQVNSSSDFSPFFSVVAYNSFVNLQLMHFLLWKKASHENTNFDTFTCSDENLPNSSCHFPNHKSVFLQILQHSLVYIVRHNSSIHFQLKLYILSTKVTYQSTNLVKFQLSSRKSEILHVGVVLMKFQLKIYRRLISHDIEE